MKLLPRLLIALVVCLLVIPMLASPVQAAGITTMTLHPTTGIVGTEVYITGSSDDTHNYWVYYEVEDNEWVQVLDEDDFDFKSKEEEGYKYSTDKFPIPESCGGKHKVAIVDEDLGADAEDDDIDDSKVLTPRDFTVKPKLEITKPSGAKGPLGVEVTVKGTGFGADEQGIAILFEGDVVSADEFKADGKGTWEGTFIVPAASKGIHSVSARGDDTAENNVVKASFEVLPGISLDSKSGSFGKTITVTGSGFNTNETGIRILFGGTTVAENIAANDDGLWERTFTVPEVVKGEYDVTAEGNYTKKADIGKVKFEVVPGLVLNPTEGHVGTTISVLGGGFPAGKTVTVTYDGVIKGTATTNTRGSFSGISFTATHTQSEHTAEHPVVATYDSTFVSGTNFIMESTAPPTPTLGSPIGGDRAGFIGWEFCPTFEWSGVTDDSGISHYSLRIASSEITAETTSFLFSRDIAVGNLTIDAERNKVSYKLPKNSALPYGDYYWQVRAVDGAQNKGEWSTAQPFHAGLLPLWANIVIIVAIVVLIGVLVYFFKKRGRGYYD